MSPYAAIFLVVIFERQELRRSLVKVILKNSLIKHIGESLAPVHKPPNILYEYQSWKLGISMLIVLNELSKTHKHSYAFNVISS